MMSVNSEAEPLLNHHGAIDDASVDFQSQGGVTTRNKKIKTLWTLYAAVLLYRTAYFPIITILDQYVTEVLMEEANIRSLSLSYQKKDGRVWPRPSFFWYDTNFSEFDSANIRHYILEKSVSYQKKDGRSHARPSFCWYDNDKDLKVCFLMTHIILATHTLNMADMSVSMVTVLMRRV